MSGTVVPFSEPARNALEFCVTKPTCEMVIKYWPGTTGENWYWPDGVEMPIFTTEESLLFFKATEAPDSGLPLSSFAKPATCWALRLS